MKWISLSAILLFSCLNSICQDILTEDSRIYGRDPLLFNGDKYTYYVPSGTEGNQFLAGEQFSPGIIKFNGAVFQVSRINYDIYNQQVVLEYSNEAGASNFIKLSQAWLESFQIGDQYFELSALPDGSPKIYQVLAAVDIRILFYWYKTLSLDMGTGSKNYVFSSPKKNCYLQMKDRCVEYKSNKSFLSVFQEEEQLSIRKFMKSHHLNVKKASDRSLTELINYCAEMEK
jgi:hypothetical protein